MEGPLVSDTAELLDAPGAPEGSPVGRVEGSKSRGRRGTGLSSLLLSDLQRLAQEMGITGAGKMRKSQLVEAIEARQGSGTAKQDSEQRASSAGAGTARPLKQGAMHDQRQSDSTGIGASTAPAIGHSGDGGIGQSAPQAQTAAGAAPSGAATAERVEVASDPAASAGTATEVADGQRGDRR